MSNTIHLRIRTDDESRDLKAACSSRISAQKDNTTIVTDEVTCKRCIKKLESGAEIINPCNGLPY